VIFLHLLTFSFLLLCIRAWVFVGRETCINILVHSSVSPVSMFSRRVGVSPGAETKAEAPSQRAEVKADELVEVVKGRGSSWKGVRWVAHG